MEITLLYFDGCPNWRHTDQDLRRLIAAGAVQADLRHLRVETPEDAERLGFRGSPTVVVDGRDPFATGDEPVGLACRVYQTDHGPRGRPTFDQVRHVLLG